MNSQQLRSFNLAITPSATKSPSETDRDSMFSLTDKSLALSSGNYPCNAVRERAESYCLIERDSSKY